jgi:hypothetical protein
VAGVVESADEREVWFAVTVQVPAEHVGADKLPT